MSLAVTFANKNKYYIIIGCTILVFLIILGTTFIVAKLKSKKVYREGEAIVLNEGNLTINYFDGNIIKQRDIEGEYTISITNTSSDRSYYTVQVNNVISDKEINIIIKDELGSELNTINKFNENNNLISLDTIDGSQTKRYKVVVNNVVNNEVELELKVINESNTKMTFSDLILINNNIKEATTNVGKEIATTDEGLVSTKDNDGISYYFRGNVENNYVKIKDNYYRIVRINGDSTVRIVLDESVRREAYNTNPLAAGATNESLLDINNASIKLALNEWYNAYINEYDKFIEEGKYCIEKEFNNMINNYTYTSVYDRIMVSQKPSLECSNELTLSKVGLLSIDEVVFAGAAKEENNKYYLYKKENNNFLTNSIYSISLDNNIYVMNVDEKGKIGEGISITQVDNIRPVINISVTTKVKGTGTKDDPYIIVA